MSKYGTLGEQLAQLQPQSFFGGFVFANDPSFGLIDDHGVSDQTAALTAAIAATPPSGTLIIPPWLIKFSNLTITTPINFLCAGASNINQAVLGDTSWAITKFPSLFAGTVLYSTSTSGSAITWESSTGINGGSLQGLLLLGPGSGSSTGLTVGGTYFVTGLYSRNCIIANFSSGVSFTFVEDSDCEFTIMGCSTGMTTDGSSTNNLFRLNIQFSTIIGLNHGGHGSRIVTSLFQDNTGAIATISSNGNTIDTPWIENVDASSGFTISGGQNLLLNPSFHNPADTLTISGNNNTYIAAGSDVSTTITGSRNTVVGELTNSLMVTPNKSNTLFLTNQVIVPTLPTSDPHTLDQLWSNSGVVTVSAG